MTTTNLTALSLLRMGELEVLPDFKRETVIEQFIQDKGFSPKVAKELSGDRLGNLIGVLLARKQYYNTEPWPHKAKKGVQPDRRLVAYHSSPEQNVQIDRALTNQYSGGFFGEGAATTLSTRGITDVLYSSPNLYHQTPIAIIGEGAAGIIAHKMLRTIGFDNITLFERRQEAAGIWSTRSVYAGTRNNPRDLDIFRHTLEKAPGSGTSVRNVLVTLSRPRFGRPIAVKRVIPGDLKHVIELADGTTKEYPIVVNACGMGLPKPISNPSKMIGPEGHVSAIRWQMPTLPQAEAKGKMFIFIGLGNSTAEMIRIIQQYKRSGVDCDYRILTHYPKDSVHNPQDTVMTGDQKYRVFRDLTTPNLTSYQGDLEISRKAYFQALLEDKIIPDVVQWEVKKESDGKRKLAIKQRDAMTWSENVSFDSLYVLTGYQHNAKTMEDMGLAYDPEKLYPHYDYDGEFMRAAPSKSVTGGDRVFKGYYGLGSILNAPHNKNSIVIPGMMFRAPDMVFGILMRVYEFHRLRKDREKAAREKAPRVTKKKSDKKAKVSDFVEISSNQDKVTAASNAFRDELGRFQEEIRPLEKLADTFDRYRLAYDYDNPYRFLK